jgi:hypothetical protein
MKVKSALFVFILLSLLTLIGSVQASNVFVIEPSKEVTQNVECPARDKLG